MMVRKKKKKKIKKTRDKTIFFGEKLTILKILKKKKT